MNNKVHCIFNGLGAGNIGDEAMFNGFVRHFPLPVGTTVEVFDPQSPILETLPSHLTYLDWKDDNKCTQVIESCRAVLLIGDTPVSCSWGLDWPLRALAHKLDFCHSRGVPVHAVGVGVDSLDSQEAREIFSRSFLPITSWTVRSSQCREALLDLGVLPERIAIAADCAWLFTPDPVDIEWARTYLARLGVDLDRPLVGVNVVNERWPGATEVKQTIAAVLDKLVKEQEVQIAFLCNEVREGEYYDVEAVKETAGLMSAPSVLVPNDYFTPSQMAGLISCCQVTLSQRYHFSLLSLLTETPVASFARGQKMVSLLAEFGQDPAGTMESCDAENLYGRLINDISAVSPRPGQDQLRKMKARAGDCSLFINHFVAKHNPRLASVTELESMPFRQFMDLINEKARAWGLREITNWSKVWEYPWLWFNALAHQDWPGKRLLDLGSELSPIPWFLASLGADVTLVEHDDQWLPVWQKLAEETGLSVSWKIVKDERLPFADAYFDVLTSFSVIEHQPDKALAVREAARVLKPGGLFAASFDICEVEKGMTFPEWNGKALTLLECERLLLDNTDFDRGESGTPAWNIEDCPAFIKWHLQSAPHHNYTVGAVFLTKKETIEEKIPQPFDIMSCRNILLPRFDTFGDIVLLQGFIQALLDLLPDARISLLVRKGYEELADLFPSRLHWLTTNIDVYANSFDVEEVRSLLHRLKTESFDTMICTTYDRVRLEDIFACSLKSVFRIGLGEEQPLPALVFDSLPELGPSAPEVLFDAMIPVEEKSTEQKKYQILWQWLSDDGGELPHPQLSVSSDKEIQAREIVLRNGLTEGNYVVIVPGGTATISVKTWPVENYARIICDLEEKFHITALVVGHVGERAIVDSVIEQAFAMGGHPQKWYGEDGELALLAALLKMSKFYLGSDTGPMHIAAALGKPVVALFGGGHWPRFTPLASGGRIFVMPLPCFYCKWHCFNKEKAPCVSNIDVAFVLEHIEKFLGQIEKGKTSLQIVKSEVGSELYISLVSEIYKGFSDSTHCIHQFKEKLFISEQDRQACLDYNKHLEGQLSVSEQHRQSCLNYNSHLEGQLSVCEEDRELRLHVIHDLQDQIAGVQGELSRLQSNRYVRILRKLRCLKYGE